MNSALLRLLRNRRLQPFWEAVHRTSLIGMNYWASEVHATGEMEAIQYVARTLNKSHPVIFDVGANLGDFSLLCLEAFHGGCEVHAFEPSSSTFSMLESALGETSVSLHDIGLSDHSRTATLRSSGLGSTIASVEDLHRPTRQFDDRWSEQVRLVTLDEFCVTNDIESVDYLKLDIEGHELKALKGAERMLREKRIGYIQFEFGENNVSSRTYMEDFDSLLGAQYRFYRIVPGGLVPWKYLGGGSEVFATMNFLCEPLS